MLGINYWAVIVTTLAAFAFSSVYYMVFGKARMKLLANEPGATADVRKVPVWKVALELVRCFVVTLVMAHVIVLARIARLAGRGATGHLYSPRLSRDDPDGLRHLGQTALEARRDSRRRLDHKAAPHRSDTWNVAVKKKLSWEGNYASPAIK